MAEQIQDIALVSLRGGMNDTDVPSMLKDDECVLAQNVEFFASALGERRNGCGALSITGSNLSNETIICHLSQWFPTNIVTTPEFFTASLTPGVSITVAIRSTASAWSNPSIKDALNFTVPDAYDMQTQSLNGKLFVAYHSAQDRAHVWDGVSLRRAGLAAPAAAPTGAETVGAGTYASVRYFRVRYAVLSGATVLLRSEPSSVLTVTPSGTKTGEIITKPAAINEGETHWELEASVDNANFYRIARTIVATTTVTDLTAYATGYSGQGPISDAIGAYLLLPSAKFFGVDGDRLIYAGHWTDLSKQSLVGWTPVQNDPGVGNDERAPLVTTGGASINNTTNLDNYDGGPITGLAASANGTWYVFKWNRIYKMVRTDDVTRAYSVITMSTTRGAIPGSVVRGVDERGASCVYFLDPSLGMSRVGPFGVQKIRGLRTTWGRINLQASSIIARGCYYPYKQQVHWKIAVDGATRPNYELVVQVSELRQVDSDAVGRGCSVWTGRITEVGALGVFTEIVNIGGIDQISDRPFVGLSSPDYIQRCDTEITDAGVTFAATIRTKPYIVVGLLNRWGAMAAALLATANATSSLVVKFLRDFSVEVNQVTTTLTPAATEGYVVKSFDDLVMSGAKTIQIEFTDP